jgi:hypothetical protein
MPHVHPPYAAFDVDCVKDVIRIIRGGTVREELPLFAKCVHTLVGAGLGATIGEPPGPLAADAVAETAVEECSLSSLEECRHVLEDLQEDGPGTFGADPAAIDPATLQMLIALAVQLITAWINRKKSA